MKFIYSNHGFSVSYVLLYILFFILMQLSVEVEALDIWRYYDVAKLDAVIYDNILDYIKHSIDINTDFIYFTSLWIACKLGVSLHLVTAMFLTMYYVISYLIVKKHFSNNSVPSFILFYAFMFAPFIWVQEISRNLAAISILYIGIKYYLDKKYIKAFVWSLLSVFTHVSMIMYFPVFILAHFINGFKLSSKYVIIIILIFLLGSITMPSFLVNVISHSIEGADSRYSYYSDGMDYVGPLQASGIGYGDKLPMTFSFIYSLILLMLNKSRDFIFWCQFGLTLLLSFFFFSSLMFTNRLIMLLTLFIVWNTISVYVDSMNSSKTILKVLGFIGCICVILHFWSYRTAFAI